jgi:hypothetical protein
MHDPRSTGRPLFSEVVEFITTQDKPFSAPDGSWGTRIARPDGAGWRLSSDKRTHWYRRRPVVIARPTKDGRWRRR